MISRYPKVSANTVRRYGEITLTVAAEFALQVGRAELAAQSVDQASQRCQVREPERAPSSRRGDEQIRFHRIRPSHRQRVLAAVLVEKEHPVLGPVLPHTHQNELAATPGMERMGHPDGPLPNVGIRSIRRRGITPSPKQ